jgi:hypothetical protein
MGHGGTITLAIERRRTEFVLRQLSTEADAA